jgi:hypothetical protein
MAVHRPAIRWNRKWVSHVADPHIAHESAHVPGAKNIPNQTFPLVHVKCIAFGGDNAGSILPAVLKHQQPVI